MHISKKGRGEGRRRRGEEREGKRREEEGREREKGGGKGQLEKLSVHEVLLYYRLIV